MHGRLAVMHGRGKAATAPVSRATSLSGCRECRAQGCPILPALRPLTPAAARVNTCCTWPGTRPQTPVAGTQGPLPLPCSSPRRCSASCFGRDTLHSTVARPASPASRQVNTATLALTSRIQQRHCQTAPPHKESLIATLHAPAPPFSLVGWCSSHVRGRCTGRQSIDSSAGSFGSARAQLCPGQSLHRTAASCITRPAPSCKLGAGVIGCCCCCCWQYSWGGGGGG